MLIERSADVTAKDREGKTPLLLASRAEIASVLIVRGADLTTEDRYGETSGVARETTGSRWCTYGTRCGCEPRIPAFDSETGVQYFQYRAIVVPYSAPCPLFVN